MFAPSQIAIRALLLAALPLLTPGCSSATARTFNVASDAQLGSAIAAAKPGDRIVLAPGSYEPLRILDRKLSGPPVVLTGPGATISFVQIMRSSGWTLDNLEIGGSFDERGRVLRIENSADIDVVSSLIRGQNMNNDPWDDQGLGVGIRASKNINISKNRFREVKVALQAAGSEKVHVRSNSIAFVREGINWIGVDEGSIRCNRISHIYPNYAAREHPDAIQFWFQNFGGSNNILIEGNFINTGGPRAVHGIFGAGTNSLEKDVNDRQRNFVVRDNIYYGSALHGLSLTGFDNIVIENNTIIGSDHVEKLPVPKRSADGRETEALIPLIRLVGATSSGSVRNNITHRMNVASNIEHGNNLMVQVRGNNATPLKRVFLNPPTGPDPALESFIVNPQSAAGKAGQGARLICGSELPPAP